MFPAVPTITHGVATAFAAGAVVAVAAVLCIGAAASYAEGASFAWPDLPFLFAVAGIGGAFGLLVACPP